MNDPTRRSIRTFLQVGLVEAFLRLLEAFGVPISEAQHAALIVFLTPFVALGQNLLEDRTAFPSLLKAPASSGQNPVPERTGGIT